MGSYGFFDVVFVVLHLCCYFDSYIGNDSANSLLAVKFYTCGYFFRDCICGGEVPQLKLPLTNDSGGDAESMQQDSPIRPCGRKLALSLVGVTSSSRHLLGCLVYEILNSRAFSSFGHG